MIVLGQVGLGYWGPNLLRNFQALPTAKVKALCDLNAEALSRAGERYPELLRTTEFADLLRDPEIGAVVVSSSATTHYRLARAALEAGKHVFVEKPIALHVGEAETLIRRIVDEVPVPT